MADLEIKVDKLDERVTTVENKVSELTANVNALIREMKDFKTEIRDRDNQRAEEIREIRQEMRDRDNQRAEEIREIRAGLDGMGKHVRNLVWTSMAAIGAMVVTVIISLIR